MMDWFNSNLYRDLAHGVAYPQLFPHHERPSDVLQAGTLAWGGNNTRGWLATLDKRIGSQRFLCGDAPTIADHFGAPGISLGELLGADLRAYPNVQRWFANAKALPSWPKVNEAFDSLARSVAGATFVSF